MISSSHRQPFFAPQRLERGRGVLLMDYDAGRMGLLPLSPPSIFSGDFLIRQAGALQTRVLFAYKSGGRLPPPRLCVCPRQSHLQKKYPVPRRRYCGIPPPLCIYICVWGKRNYPQKTVMHKKEGRADLKILTLVLSSHPPPPSILLQGKK